MNIASIEIHAGKPDFEFTPLRRLEAKAEGRTIASRPPTNADVDLQLRQLAAKIGADAVIEVEYQRGVSMTSWQSLKGTGLAVKRIADTRTCPACAETIKRAAIKCRFCGTELLATDTGAQDSSRTELAGQQINQSQNIQTRAPKPHIPQEPLKSTDNSRVGIIIVCVIMGILFLSIVLSGG